MTTHFIIPDTHFKPGMDFTHVKYLARAINDLQPDALIHLGDWADFESLCSYDKGKRSHEQKRYIKDVQAANEALNVLESALTYQPKTKVYIAGNHDEGRIKKAIEEDPQRCEGLLSLDDIRFSAAGWKVQSFGKPKELDGVLYCHYFTGGVMGRPIGGENPATAMIKSLYLSCTAGHTHTRDFSERTRADGKRLLGLLAGCYLPPDYRPSYAGTMPRQLWWSGVVVKRDVKDGYYNPEFIDFAALKGRYHGQKKKADTPRNLPAHKKAVQQGRKSRAAKNRRTLKKRG